MGGDKFGVLIPKSEFDPYRVERTLSNYVVTDGNIEHSLFIHLGVYEVTKTDTDVSVMFDRAHLALSTIKDDYKTHIAYYDDELREKAKWNQHISTQLQHAISQKQVVPYLQPIVDDSGKVVGAEALARWNHPDRGFLSPASFIPYFEKNGLIVEVDKHMWRSACEILSRWEQIDKEMFISVNISPKDFYFMDVKEEIHNLVEEYGIEPKRLRIEITETVMMNDIDERIKILNELRSEGFIVEMDDFGSGYSSLNQLKDMPLDVLKIDMKFLSKAQDNNKAETILRNILRLSNDLGLFSLTEGVETKDQYKKLNEMGCNLFQGYYFAKPMSVTDYEKLLGTQQLDKKRSN
jgi:EAL domain-containing protein (putative c-di-GMP-specific phosphodiesterase class I)